ncbi:DUF2459 domain-containing protein [Roseococcus sp. DSY-14]|uniref:DUF2459 domain-containing protein n=1 Tax=Roseococcus sp. DSY-14 TaxID=3369650 RepID=UPI00387B974C
MARLPALLLLPLAACAGREPPPCPPGHEAALAVLDRGIHAELNVEAAALVGRPRALARGAPALRLGYGKAGFFDIPGGPGIVAHALAPLPGPAVMEALPVAALPDPAVDAPAYAVPLRDPGGFNAFLDATLPEGPLPPGRFLPARPGYSLLHTCNTWVARGLGAAGLPVSSAGTVRVSGIVAQLAAVPGACRLR